MVQVDLTKKPFNLQENDIKWVENTINNMSEEEKIGQLFFHFFDNFEEDYIKDVLDNYHIGGMRYLTKEGAVLQNFINYAQQKSKLPLFVAANCDAGGNGAVSEGTYIASGAQVEAAGDQSIAYNVGYVSGVESKAIGVNWNFGPNADILFNWRNTIVNTRAYGNDPEAIIKYNRSFIEGLRESNVMGCLKHFPGDGVDERDQHLLLSVNDLEVEEWENSYGKVYQAAIDEGLQTIMLGHIALPKYQKKLNPSLEDKDILPATLSPEIATTLLKDKMKFNGLIVTDASHMIGLAASMQRKDYVPLTIAAGCDMFLFFNDLEEDFNYMLEGYRNGIITDERLEAALKRILGMKAKLGLHKKSKEELIVGAEELDKIASDEFIKWQEEAADKAITLVKNTKDELPITPQTHPRIKLYLLYGEEGGAFGFDKSSKKVIIEELEEAGFEVDLHTNIERAKGKIEEYKENYDASFVFADIQGYATENNIRIRWGASTSNEIPWYVHETPTVFVSLNFTTHLTDVPMVKTYINSYKNTRTSIRQTIQKIMGQSEFKGKYNENVFCDKWDTRL